ncbi:MAG: hydroxymethylbilane synthase [Burkholderiales bacterium]
MKLAIATRRSRLALWQAEHVRARLAALHPGLEVTLLPLTTRGDELLEERLDEVGGKGLFVKELEQAMADGRAGLAVHSMKDVPAALPEGFRLAAILEREDPRDAFVSARHASLDALPRGARVGTSSLRRAAQVAARRPDLELATLRGNVETRLAKLDRGEYEAIVLAAAGLKRLGLEARIRALLTLEQCLPAPGQAALGVECLAARTDVAALVAPLAHEATAACVRAERAVSLALGGSCTIPLGAYAHLEGGRIRLRALVAAPDGARFARTECEGPATEPEALGEQAAIALRAQGAESILAALTG